MDKRPYNSSRQGKGTGTAMSAVRPNESALELIADRPPLSGQPHGNWNTDNPITNKDSFQKPKFFLLNHAEAAWTLLHEKRFIAFYKIIGRIIPTFFAD
jgi:hypothetical protein